MGEYKIRPYDFTIALKFSAMYRLRSAGSGEVTRMLLWVKGCMNSI